MREQQDLQPNIVGIRVSEWTEWIPCFPDAATNGDARLPQGVSMLEMAPGERLMEIKTQVTPLTVMRWVIENDNGTPTILDEGQEPDEEDKEKAGQTMFRLMNFHAVMAASIEPNQADDYGPLIKQNIPKQGPKADIAIASSMPPNREQRRGGKKRG